ncbi:MAG: 4-hydroxybenzoate polyprenyltransferase [Moraxellaceae bacterium]|jgi:4-hydroxybenzoate polyprenyltransferase|nr:4-hydroxybenzoate polyprenyltransferase [Moraxellaceae bacterium]
MSASLFDTLLARFPRLPDFLKLARFDRPIGTWLLLWPTLWAVYIAGDGRPPLGIIVVFSLGVVLMRAAGCVINDLADRNFDGQVARTRERPLATGRIGAKEAAAFFIVLLALAASLLLFLNKTTFYWAFGAVALASLYPFMKRFTHLPQVVLGAAFSWGIPMAFVAQGKVPGPECWLLFVGNLCWTVAYDTYYAMADRDDDLKAGIKSTAILFGDMDLMIIGSLQAMFVLALWMLAGRLGLAWPFAVSLLGVLALFAWEFRLAGEREPARCLQAFLHNHWAGALLFAGVFLGYLFKAAPVVG